MCQSFRVIEQSIGHVPAIFLRYSPRTVYKKIKESETMALVEFSHIWHLLSFPIYGAC